MKVDSKHIAEAFTEIKCLLDGIADVIQMGDDGLEDCILSMTKDIRTVVNVFTIEHMTPVVKPGKEPAFLKRHLELHEKSLEPGAQMEPYENILLFKARFYLFIKRELQKISLEGVANHELHNVVYSSIVADSKYDSYFLTDFANAAYGTINLVTDEIIEHRRRFPQMAICFEHSTKEEDTKKLIDKL